MDEFMTDVCTLGVLEGLSRSGREVLHGYLRDCARQRPCQPSELQHWNKLHFASHTVISMRMEKQGKDPHRIKTRIVFENGTTWNGTSLSLPCLLPEAVLPALSGRHVDEVVEGSTMGEMRISQARNGKKGAILRLKGVKEGKIPYRAPAERRK